MAEATDKLAVELRDRELLAAQWVGDQWADVRKRILDGSCSIHSDPISLVNSLALDALSSIRAEAVEEAARYHDCLADVAQQSWDKARSEGLEFANQGQRVAAEHKRHAAAIRALTQSEQE